LDCTKRIEIQIAIACNRGKRAIAGTTGIAIACNWGKPWNRAHYKRQHGKITTGEGAGNGVQKGREKKSITKEARALQMMTKDEDE
jgi:hypothetical protein